MLGMRGVSGPRTDVLRKAGPKWAGKLLVRSVQTVDLNYAIWMPSRVTYAIKSYVVLAVSST